MPASVGGTRLPSTATKASSASVSASGCRSATKAPRRVPVAVASFSMTSGNYNHFCSATFMFKTLISTDVLAARLADPLWVIVDCRFKLDDVAWGEREWAAARIPGAVYAHLDRDLSGPKTGTNGRHPLPDPAELAGTFGRLGGSDRAQGAPH